jgi:glyoxylase-like metal-dependent hydrolase (beta-lactamase superfamily II)
MLNVKTFQCNMLGENCYVVSDETRESVIIDCGAQYPEERMAISQYIKKEALKPIHLLCTHGHLDHCFGNIFMMNEFGLKPEVSGEDLFLIEDLDKQARNMFGFSIGEPTPPIGHLFSTDEEISFGNHRLQILPTPGHTPGSVVFYCKEESLLFSGDTLFRMSIGRTDFERGSWTDMMHSLHEVLAKLPANTVVYTGHGPETNIGDEVQMNPYFR